MITVDALDVVLRIQNLRAFQAGMGQAAASVKGVGAAAGTATKGTDKLSASQQRAAHTAGLMGKASRNAVLAAGVAAYAGMKMGIRLDEQMNQVKVVTGESTESIKTLRKEILGLAGPTGFDPTELAQSMAAIAKIGLPHVDRLELLRAAADGAAVGMAKVTTTTDTLAGSLKVHMPGMSKDVRTAMGQLITAAQTGNMTLEDFNHAMGTGILPAAKVYGLSLTDITGALAIFTDEHMQGSSATAQLATSFHFLTGATEGAEKALQTLGLSGTEMSDAMRSPRGLLKALTLLKEHLDSYSSDKSVQTDLLNKILPGGRGRILLVLMNQLENYQDKMDQQEKATNNFEKNVVQTHETTAQRIRDAWAGLKAELITLTDSETFGDAVTGILWVLEQTIKLVKELKVPILLAAGTWATYKTAVLLAGGAQLLFNAASTVGMWLSLISMVRSAADAWFLLDAAMAANPAVLIVMAVIALVVLLVVLYKKWGWFHRAVDNTWDWIKSHWKLLGAILLGPFAPLIAIIGTVLAHLKDLFGWAVKLYNKIKSALGLKKPQQDPISAKAYVKHPSLMPVAPPDRDKIPTTATPYSKPQGKNKVQVTRRPGGSTIPVTPTSNRSKRVHTPDPAPAPTAQEKIDVHSHVYLDSKELTSVFTKKLADKRARK